MGTKVIEFSESAIMERFLREHASDASDFLFNTRTKSFYRWNGTLYVPDEKTSLPHQVHLLARELAECAAREGKESIARQLSTNRFATEVVKLISKDPRVTVVDSELDADPMLWELRTVWLIFILASFFRPIVNTELQ